MQQVLMYETTWRDYNDDFIRSDLFGQNSSELLTFEKILTIQYSQWDAYVSQTSGKGHV